MITEDEARERIMMALGAASMCWEDAFESKGVFLSQQCIDIGEQLLIELELKEIAPGS